MANEKRLIDANALMDAFRKYMTDRYDREKCVSAENCKTCEPGCLWRKKVSAAPTVDAVEVVRCKDCKYFKPAYFKADDGTETPWDGTFSFDGRSDGIHYGARCKHERNTAYGQKDMAFRKPDDFCSYGEKEDRCINRL